MYVKCIFMTILYDLTYQTVLEILSGFLALNFILYFCMCTESMKFAILVC